jgi:hypothetical protein
VANNLLAKVPPSIGHLKTLKEFNLRYNSLDDRWVHYNGMPMFVMQ